MTSLSDEARPAFEPGLVDRYHRQKVVGPQFEQPGAAFAKAAKSMRGQIAFT